MIVIVPASYVLRMRFIKVVTSRGRVSSPAMEPWKPWVGGPKRRRERERYVLIKRDECY